ncbi:hypothetical protein E2F47_23830 [Mycobacterium eburneum]|nr:hypothetical protein [Mycobacterium eburneum]TDH48402.1 hypothetical protein E2F47_23830 [Mycobacterium eburneum]
MTSTVVRWVLVDGVTGDGDAVDRGALGIGDIDAFDADALLATLVDGADLHAVGLTWSPDAAAAAAKVQTALGGAAHAVSDVAATELLASGIADLAGYDFLVVCAVEPGATVVATVNARRVTAQRLPSTDATPPIEPIRAAVHGVRPRPDAIFVLGSGDADAVVAALQDQTGIPVITAAEADFALPRGAALAAARADTVPAAPVMPPRNPRVRVLASVLAAAVVVLVVALSLAVAPRLQPSSPRHPQHSTAAHQTPATPPRAKPTVAPAAQPSMLQPLLEEQPPVYVPPAAPAPPPRIRDRIKEKLPRLNPFR